MNGAGLRRVLRAAPGPRVAPLAIVEAPGKENAYALVEMVRTVSPSPFDTAPRARRIAARFPEPFAIFFRASWIDNDRAFAVNRNWPRSHFVLFDEFLSPQ